jgi:hypothetical protein
LHWVNRIRTLHHHALGKIAAERPIRGMEPLVERKRLGCESARRLGVSTMAPHGTGRDASPLNTASIGISASSIARRSS